MKNYSPAYAAHLQQSNTTLAICWRIVKKNGELILGTDHDRDIAIEDTNIGLGDSGSLAFSLNGVYKASSGITGSDIKSGADMSVDNMEVQGAIAQHGAIIDLSVADIEAGLLDGAEVTTFRVNWQDPSDFQEVLRHGVLGEITRDSDGVYRTEIRGLKQLLSQVITRTFSERCQVVRFGDSECKYEIANDTITGTVTSVTSARRFTATLDFVRAVSGAGAEVLVSMVPSRAASLMVASLRSRVASTMATCARSSATTTAMCTAICPSGRDSRTIRKLETHSRFRPGVHAR